MGFTLEQMRAELGRREEAAAERRGPTRLEPLARVRRWLDAGDDRELFAEAARRLASNVEAERTGGPDMASRIGGLFHLAGEPADARRYLLDSLRDPAAWIDPSDRAGAHYLLGAPERAIATAPDSIEALLARAQLDGNPGLARVARERLLALDPPSGGDGPHLGSGFGGMPLTLWDWIEETFLLEARLLDKPPPSHLEMLERTGRLLDEEPPARHDPPVRTGWEVTIPTRPPGSGEVAASLKVAEDGEVELVLDPRPDHFPSVVLNPDGGQYAVGISSDPYEEIDWVTVPYFDTFQAAAEYAADHLRAERGTEGDWLADTIHRLMAAHDTPDPNRR